MEGKIIARSLRCCNSYGVLVTLGLASHIRFSCSVLVDPGSAHRESAFDSLDVRRREQMCEITNASRRQFLKTGAAVTGGLLLGFHLPLGNARVQAAKDSGSLSSRMHGCA